VEFGNFDPGLPGCENRARPQHHHTLLGVEFVLP
jgi:hypothetical protein